MKLNESNIALQKSLQQANAAATASAASTSASRTGAAGGLVGSSRGHIKDGGRSGRKDGGSRGTKRGREEVCNLPFELYLIFDVYRFFFLWGVLLGWMMNDGLDGWMGWVG